MAEANTRNRTDEVDDLFDYGAGLDDILHEVEQNNRKAFEASDGTKQGGTGDAGLGLDEEVKVTKKRAPIPKLDEARLLSKAGIPRLRQRARKNLKFKGKGHEFSDVARLLNFYQLWLDDLYPRAKFADGLAMIEKLGHSKRLQAMRREWIDEGRSGFRSVPNDAHTDVQMGNSERSANATGEEEARDAFEVLLQPQDSRRDQHLDEETSESSEAEPSHSLFGGEGGGESENRRSIFDDIQDDDDLFVSDDDLPSRAPDTNGGRDKLSEDGGNYSGDDFDAMLAEATVLQKSSNTNVIRPQQKSTEGNEDDGHENEWEAMDDLGF